LNRPRTNYPQILSATERNSVDAATLRPGFACTLKLVIFNIFDLKIILKCPPHMGFLLVKEFSIKLSLRKPEEQKIVEK
jgi:hypothetical protein